MADKPKPKPLPSNPPACTTCRGRGSWYINGVLFVCTACSGLG